VSVQPSIAEAGPEISRPAISAGGVQSLAFRAGEVVANTSLVIVTARLMEPAGRGLFALASLAALLCGLPLGAVWSANAIELAKGRRSIRELLGSSLVIASLGGMLTMLIALGVAATLGSRWWVVAFPALMSPLILLARYGEGLFQAMGHVRAVNWCILARATLPVLFVTPVLLIGASDAAAIGWWTASLGVLAIGTLIPLWRLAGRPVVPRDPQLYKRLLQVGGKLALGNSAQLVNARLALIALAIFSSAATVGVYSVAVAAGEMMYLTTYALSSSAFREIGTGALLDSVDLTARSLRHSLLLATAIGVALVPATAIVLPFIVGDGYHDVTTILIVLAPGMVLQGAFYTLQTFFTVQLDKPHLVMRISVIGMIANVVLAIAFVPVWGAWGAALAATLSNGVSAAIAMHRFLREGNLKAAALVPGGSELSDYRQLAATLRDRA
jgi:O-antigen/teichoic acid export membrane protein